MYSSYFSQELAHARINDHLVRAEARRLAAAARRARPRRQRISMPTVPRLLQLSPMTRRPAT